MDCFDIYSFDWDDVGYSKARNYENICTPVWEDPDGRTCANYIEQKYCTKDGKK